MDKSSRQILKYILIFFCIIVILCSVLLLSGVLEGQFNGFRVVRVEPDKAGTGVITYITDEDLKASPALEDALSRNVSGSVRVSEEEFKNYTKKYYYLASVDNTTKHRYFEYAGTYFYLEFHEGDKVYPPPYF